MSAEIEEGGPSSLGGRRKASLQGHDALHSYSPQSTQCKHSGCDTVDTSPKKLAFGKTAHSNNMTRGENTTGAGPSKAAQLHKQNTNNDHGWMPLLHGILEVHKAHHCSPDSLSQRKEKPRSYNNVHMCECPQLCSLKTTQILLTRGLANLLHPSSGVLITNKKEQLLIPAIAWMDVEGTVPNEKANSPNYTLYLLHHLHSFLK